MCYLWRSQTRQPANGTGTGATYYIQSTLTLHQYNNFKRLLADAYCISGSSGTCLNNCQCFYSISQRYQWITISLCFKVDLSPIKEKTGGTHPHPSLHIFHSKLRKNIYSETYILFVSTSWPFGDIEMASQVPPWKVTSTVTSREVMGKSFFFFQQMCVMSYSIRRGLGAWCLRLK